jgi:hypothetical protein
MDLVEFFFGGMVFVVKHMIKFCDGLYGMAESPPWPWGGSVNPHLAKEGGPLSLILFKVYNFRFKYFYFYFLLL